MTQSPAPTDNSTALLSEFVRFCRDDGMLLHGLLWTPAQPTDALVLYVPGMTGGFVSPHDLNTFAGELVAAGYPVLATNLHTAGMHGMLFAHFPDYAEDLRAAIDYAQQRGYRRILLVGDSLGGPRCAYYLAHNADPRVRALALMASITSPYEEAQLRWDASRRADFDTLLQRCRDCIAAGNTEEVIAFPHFTPGRTIAVSARTWIEIFGQPQECDASTIKFGPQLKLPTLVIHGINDVISIEENAQRIYDSLTASERKKLAWVEGGHFFETAREAKNFAAPLIEWARETLARD